MEHLKGRHLIIRADAGMQIGTGHLMRCLALAQAWKDAGGKVVFITACETGGLLKRLKEEGFDTRQLTKPYPDRGDWECTGGILHGYPNAWVVLDGYHFDEVYQQRVKEAGHRLLVIDDMAHLKHYYADTVLNQNLYAEQLRYSCQPYTRLLLGTSYVLLRREFLAWRGWKREIPEVAQQVLVTLGGSDAENHTLKVIQALQNVDVPDLEAIVVIGASNPHADVLEAAIRRGRLPIRLINSPRNMPQLMAWADVAISGAGVTCWELAYMGVPTILEVLAPNQEAIANALEESGFALGDVREHSQASTRAAQLVQELATDKRARTAMSRIGRFVVDGDGVQRILESLKNEVDGRIPVANKTDRIGSTDLSNGSREDYRSFKVVFMGAKQAGCVGLLTLLAMGCRIQGVVAYDDTVEKLAATLRLPIFSSIKQPEVEMLVSGSDLLVSVHGREVVPKKLFELPHFGSINVHPCLYRYKGPNPVGRLLNDGCVQASVGVHRMTENVDQGEVIAEEFVDVAGKRSIEEVYNVLYPFYAVALLKALQMAGTSHESIYGTRTYGDKKTKYRD